MKFDSGKLRKEYLLGRLKRAELPDNPIDLFKNWLDAAIAHSDEEANAMTLATADSDGRPSARTVLLKQFDENGFVFCTNYESRKGREMRDNPWAALLFYWPVLQRQVRIEGPVHKMSAAESSAFFNARPPDSRISAWASRQSQPVESREMLEERFREYQQRFQNDNIPLPDFWGGLRLQPHRIEFWQGRENRLHDRYLYSREDETAGNTHSASPEWQIICLSP